MSAFYKDTRFNGKLVRLEDVIQETTERAIQVIDDSLYELIGTSESNPDEFYMDYKEAFGYIVEELQKFPPFGMFDELEQKMKKRKLNSKNLKYKTEAQIKATVQEVEKRIFVSQAKRCKVYAAFYK